MYTFDQVRVMISRMQIIVNPTHAIKYDRYRLCCRRMKL